MIVPVIPANGYSSDPLSASSYASSGTQARSGAGTMIIMKMQFFFILHSTPYLLNPWSTADHSLNLPLNLRGRILAGNHFMTELQNLRKFLPIYRSDQQQ